MNVRNDQEESFEPSILSHHFISINDMRRQVMSAVSGSQSNGRHDHLILVLAIIFSQILENYRSCDPSMALLVKCRNSQKFLVFIFYCFCKKYSHE